MKRSWSKDDSWLSVVLLLELLFFLAVSTFSRIDKESAYAAADRALVLTKVVVVHHKCAVWIWHGFHVNLKSVEFELRRKAQLSRLSAHPRVMTALTSLSFIYLLACWRVLNFFIKRGSVTTTTTGRQLASGEPLLLRWCAAMSRAQHQGKRLDKTLWSS